MDLNSLSTRLFQAIQMKNLQDVVKLLDVGANINHQNADNETSLVYMAKRWCCLRHVKQYRVNGRPVNANKRCDWPIINLLLERKADKTIEDKDGHSYEYYINKRLYEAVENNMVTEISLIIQAGACTNYRQKLNSNSILTSAFRMDQFAIANELMLFMKPEDLYQEFYDFGYFKGPNHKLKVYKLFRSHLYKLAGLMLFRAFPHDIAKSIYDMLLQRTERSALKD